MPRSSHIHKSMLLRGVEFGPPALDRGDIEAIKGRAGRSGRSYGGAPLRGDHSNGRGRGGQINYAESRPNPFAAHINPNFSPQKVPNNLRGGLPPPPSGNWGPPPPGTESSWRGPPSHVYGGPPYGFSPSAQGVPYGRPNVPHLPLNSHYDGYFNANEAAGHHFPAHQGYYGANPSGGRGGQGNRNAR